MVQFRRLPSPHQFGCYDPKAGICYEATGARKKEIENMTQPTQPTPSRRRPIRFVTGDIRNAETAIEQGTALFMAIQAATGATAFTEEQVRSEIASAFESKDDAAPTPPPAQPEKTG